MEDVFLISIILCFQLNLHLSFGGCFPDSCSEQDVGLLTWEGRCFLCDRKKILRMYNVMVQSSASASAVEIWFPTNNLSCGWRIVMKFWYNVCNHKRKVGIDFRGIGPYRLSKRGQKGEKWVIFQNHYRMFIFNTILMILSLLYFLIKFCQQNVTMNWMVFERFKSCGGLKRGNTQKKFSFLIFGPILKILLSLESS